MNTNNAKTDFFGKDPVTSFIGIVEDVNDPKHAGRVKVRCVGWHPAEKKGEDGLSTEDLPWARVGSPTTHAQQNRIGGKHGLLVGSWVYGIFLDGDDAQQPLILNSFPMTAKAVDKNNKQIGQGEATAGEQEEAFGLYVQNKNHPNIGVVTDSEKGQTNFSHEGDPNGSLPALDDSDSDCGGKAANQSVASKRRKDELKKEENGNPEGQIYEVIKGDGRCGPTAHASEDAQRKMKEQMPPQDARFQYNDVVWNLFTGNYMNISGMMMALAMDLCSLFKFAANANKAELEKRVNRTLKSTTLVAIPDRDFALAGPRQIADRTTTQTSDEMHAAFQEGFIDILCDLIMQMLMGMGGGGGDNDSGGDSDPNNPNVISDSAAKCLADQVTNNIYGMMEDALDEAQRVAEEKVSSGGGGGGSSSSSISSILGLLMQGMQFAMMDEYAEEPRVHNTAGNRSQDKKNKEEGCNEERKYNTLLGSLPMSGGGGGAGGSGGGAGSGGSGTDYQGYNWQDVGFGGYPGPADGVYNDIPCEDATTPKEPDPGYSPDGTPPAPPAYDPTDPTSPSKPPVYVPDGGQGSAIPLPLPAPEGPCADNFNNGRPNTIIITNPGEKYYFTNHSFPKNAFPNIYISGYRGKPVPVVDRVSGELVAIITACTSWSPNPAPPVVIQPGEEEVGITTDDPNYDIILQGFHIANTGFEYCDPVVEIYDKDKRTTSNAKVQPILRDGRIVDMVVINSGTGFKRIPEVRIYDNGKKCGNYGGHGAVLYPIMGVVPIDNAKPPVTPVEAIYCPAKNFKNNS
jgi:hypothetical protein